MTKILQDPAEYATHFANIAQVWGILRAFELLSQARDEHPLPRCYMEEVAHQVILQSGYGEKNEKKPD